MKKILSIFLVVALFTLALTACSTKRISPRVSDENEAAATATEGSTTYTVTRGELYDACKRSHGLTSLLAIADEAILKEEKNASGVSYWDLASELLAEELAKAIYAGEEESAELKEKYYNKMLLYFGFDEEHADEYFQLTLARKLYEQDWYLSDKEITDFKEEEYKRALDELYPKEIRAVILDYTSTPQLEGSLLQENIKITDGAWTSTEDGHAMTNDEVALAFIHLYNTIHQAEGEDGLYIEGRDYLVTNGAVKFLPTRVGVWSQETLKSVASSLPTYIMKTLADGQYTLAPKTYASGAVSLLIYRVDVEQKSLDDVHDEVLDELFAGGLTSTVQAKALNALRSKYGFVISDSYLKDDYQETLADIGAKYPKVKKKKDAVAQTTLGVITADDLYAYFLASYATLELPDLMTERRNLESADINTIYLNDTVLDPTLWTKAKWDAQKIKDDFNNGTYKDAGYPKSFGWENYLKEIYGCTSDSAFITHCLQEVIATKYKKSFYEISSLKETDKLAQDYVARINASLDQYFAVDFTALSLVRYDKSGEKIAYERWTDEEKSAGHAFAEEIRALLSDKTYATDPSMNAEALVHAYATALRYLETDKEWVDTLTVFRGVNLSKYLSLGFVLQSTTEKAYTGGAEDEIDKVLKEYWESGNDVEISEAITASSGLNVLILKDAVNRTAFNLALADGITLSNLQTFIKEEKIGRDSTLAPEMTKFLEAFFQPLYKEYTSTYMNYQITKIMSELSWETNGKMPLLLRYFALRLENYVASLKYTKI